jgi:hypothetical protein
MLLSTISIPGMVFVNNIQVTLVFVNRFQQVVLFLIFKGAAIAVKLDVLVI